MRSSQLVLFTKYYEDDKIEKDEMIWHVARIGDTRNTNFRLKKLKGTDHLEDIGVDGRMIL
jgi:hypothetical protein